MLQGLTTGGVRVPHDIALIGYDDIDFAATAAVPLTSVHQPREQLGRTAAQLLLEEAEDSRPSWPPPRGLPTTSGGTPVDRDGQT